MFPTGGTCGTGRSSCSQPPCGPPIAGFSRSRRFVHSRQHGSLTASSKTPSCVSTTASSAAAAVPLVVVCIAAPIAACLGLRSAYHFERRTATVETFSAATLPHGEGISPCMSSMTLGEATPFCTGSVDRALGTIVLVGDSNAEQFIEIFPGSHPARLRPHVRRAQGLPVCRPCSGVRTRLRWCELLSFRHGIGGGAEEISTGTRHNGDVIVSTGERKR